MTKISSGRSSTSISTDSFGTSFGVSLFFVMYVTDNALPGPYTGKSNEISNGEGAEWMMKETVVLGGGRIFSEIIRETIVYKLNQAQITYTIKENGQVMIDKSDVERAIRSLA